MKTCKRCGGDGFLCSVCQLDLFNCTCEQLDLFNCTCEVDGKVFDCPDCDGVGEVEK